MWQNWILPKISEATAYTSAAMSEAATRCREGHFDDEMDSLIDVRTDGGTYSTSTLEALPALLRCLQGLACRVGDMEARAAEEKKVVTRFDAWAAKVEKEEALFLSEVERRQAAEGNEVRRIIAEEAHRARQGNKAMEAHMPKSLRIHDHKSPKTAKLSLDEVVGASVAQASVAAKLFLPIVHVWDLNTGDM